MSDKNFKVKNGISIQGTTSDTLITADNNGGMLIGGNATVSANNPVFTGSAAVIPSGTTAERPVSAQVGSLRLNTDGGVLEVWNGSVWQSAAGTPPPPSSLVATNVGTSRAYNNAAASIAFTTPTSNGGSTITGYTVTSSPGSYTGTGLSSPITVAGLQSSTQYTFSATSTNTLGIGGVSSSTAPLTVTSVPQAPTIGAVTRVSNTQVSVAFTAGATGGSAITSYSIVSSPSIALTYSGTSSPITVTGSFAASTAYTFTVAAVNANGTSTASSSSSSVSPNNPPTSLQMLVVAGGGRGGNNPGNNVGTGGGGAGGLLSNNATAISAGTVYTVTVGAASSPSSFGNLVSTTAGGNGGAFPSQASNSGGSGGGSSPTSNGAFQSGAGGTGGQGYSGGGSGVNASGGGGGSAGAGGQAGVSSGGGGGGRTTFLGATYAGGGNGSSEGANGTGGAGEAFTGSGGGGSGNGASGGAGGSGTVIISYATSFGTPNTLTGSPTLTNNGSNYVYKFNGNGTVGW